jgi:hypothetical protein
MLRLANFIFAGALCVVVSMVILAMATRGERVAADASATPDSLAGIAAGDDPASTGDSGNSTPVGNRYRVEIRRPEGPPLVELAGSDPQGRSGKVACSTCHSVRKPNRENKTSASLDEFHQGLQVSHGSLACYACHNAENTDTLRLADSTAVQYADVMTLCSQCHAAQAASFAHGAHGGMNGFWDLSRGPQTKNNCIDCHDPHAPNYPKMIVGFKPRDRFLEGEASHDDH